MSASTAIAAGNTGLPGKWMAGRGKAGGGAHARLSARYGLPATALLALFCASPAPAADPAASFPKAQPGETRWRIELPAVSNEERLKVELIPGKNAVVDCNIHRLMGEIEEQTLAGWGYPYYRLKSKGEMLGTLMACPEQAAKESFVTGAPLMLRYNSRLPIMVYTTEGLEIRYRIWRADAPLKATKD